jgi:tRNA dimethylallyltransferase
VAKATGRLVALYGPTSSGKTALSVDVAEQVERETGRAVVVISADSRQVYRYMDIGTSKTTRGEMRGVRHEMLDVLEPARKLELEDYVRRARGYIADTLAEGGVPFIVGGTGIYVKALLEGWSTDRVGSARDALRRDFPRSMAADAHAMLRRLDKAAAGRVHPNNYEAVINALAATMGRTEPATEPSVRTVVLGLDPGARAVEQRVTRTFDGQVSRGLLDEVLSLDERYDLTREFHRRGPDAANQVLHTHGYREYFEVARERGRPVGRLDAKDLVEVRERVLDHIHRYTRRQRSFLAKLTGARVVTSKTQAASAILGR